jgi:tetratricopeptide (TPR) repeat protein
VPKPPPFPPPGRGPQLLERAAFALRTQRFAEAEQLASEVLKANRTDIGAVTVLAQALIAQRREADAVAPLEKAARRGSNPGIETLLGAALGGAGRRAEAIELLQRTTMRRPPFLPAFQELAGQFARDGRFEEAIAAIESALALAPHSIDLQLDLGRLHLQRNDRGKARAILDKALEAAPGRPDLLTTLARALLLDGEYALAADNYRRALGLRPDDAMTRADLAACLLEMGDREAGEASLRAALRSRSQMLGRAIYGLAVSSHGRFFLRPSTAAKFLQGEDR